MNYAFGKIVTRDFRPWILTTSGLPTLDFYDLGFTDLLTKQNPQKRVAFYGIKGNSFLIFCYYKSLHANHGFLVRVSILLMTPFFYNSRDFCTKFGALNDFSK